MLQANESRADRLYRAVMRILPFDFRSEFGEEMEEVFRQQRIEAESERGLKALWTMWRIGIADIFTMAPREHLSILSQDLRFAARMMKKNPGYALGAIMILSLGIGVNTAIFGIINSVLLQPLPFVQGNRLVIVHQSAQKAGVDNLSFSVPEIEDYRKRNTTLSGVAEYHSMLFTLFGENEAQRVRTGVVSADFFNLFGVHPLMGRLIRPSDENIGAPAVLVLSYEFWKLRAGGNPNIIGHTYRMNDKLHTVVGVLPPFPQYPSENDVYMPTSACPFRSSAKMIADRDSRMMSLFGRLKPGETLDRSRSEMGVIAAALQHEYPKSYPAGVGYKADALSLRSELTSRARPMLILLLGAALFVLLIACANVANLILARMARREQEIVVRTAMGAGASRLLRQLLTENMLIAAAAATLGLLMSIGSVKLLTQFATQLTPRAREISIDGWVLCFAILCATATTIIFGSAAALRGRYDVSSGLRTAANRASTGKTVRNVLIATQVAFSCILLIGAGLMVRSFIKLNNVNPGFVTQQVVVANFDPNWAHYMGHPDQVLSFTDRLLTKVRAQPDVIAAAVSSSYPLDPDSSMGGGWTDRLQVEGENRTMTETAPVHSMRAVTPDYFRTLGIPLLDGRSFTDADKPDSLPVAMVSSSLARRRFGKLNPVGRRVSLDQGKHWITIVGVVGNVKEFGLAEAAPDQLYRPVTQSVAIGALLVRTAGSSSAVVAQLRSAIRDVDPETAIPYVERLEQTRQQSISAPRTTVSLIGSFAALAFVIAIAGIASMLVLWVKQRTREIGIRMAVGASSSNVIGIVIREGMWLVLVGLVTGCAGAIALTRFLKTLLFEITPTDVSTYFGVCGLVLGAALVACWIPGRQAALIDPQVALRAD